MLDTHTAVPCLEIVTVARVALNGVLRFTARARAGLALSFDAEQSRKSRGTHPLSAVINTSATFLPLATFAAEPASLLTVHQSTDVPCALARSAIGSCGWRGKGARQLVSHAIGVPWGDRACPRGVHSPRRDTGSWRCWGVMSVRGLVDKGGLNGTYPLPHPTARTPSLQLRSRHLAGFDKHYTVAGLHETRRTSWAQEWRGARRCRRQPSSSATAGGGRCRCS